MVERGVGAAGIAKRDVEAEPDAPHPGEVAEPVVGDDRDVAVPALPPASRVLVFLALVALADALLDEAVEEARLLLRCEPDRRADEVRAFAALVRDEPNEPVRIDEFVVVDEGDEIGVDSGGLVEGAVPRERNAGLLSRT